jgi:hypothetical protein
MNDLGKFVMGFLFFQPPFKFHLKSKTSTFFFLFVSILFHFLIFFVFVFFRSRSPTGKEWNPVNLNDMNGPKVTISDDAEYVDPDP